MGTYVQFAVKSNAIDPFAKGALKGLRQTIVIAGRSEPLRRRALGRVIDWLGPSTFERINGSDLSVRALLSRLSSAPMFGRPDCVIVEDAQRLKPTEPLLAYALDPTLNMFLVLLSNQVRDGEGERILPTHDKILHIDCSIPDFDTLRKICLLEGTPDEDVDFMLKRFGGDVDELMRIIDLASIFDKPWPPGLLHQLTPSVSKADDLAVLDIFALAPPTSEPGFAMAARRRVLSLVKMSALIVSLGKGPRPPTPEVARRVDCEVYLTGKIALLAKTRSCTQWLETLSELISLEAQAREGRTVIPLVLVALSSATRSVNTWATTH